jgi:hypothetical protein
MPPREGDEKMAQTDCSEIALKAAKELVAYIEFFRSHGTGECMKKFPDDEPMGGYENIVRRAAEMAAAIEDCSRAYGAHGRTARLRAAAPRLAVALQSCMIVMEMDKAGDTVAWKMGKEALEGAGKKVEHATNLGPSARAQHISDIGR